MSSPKPSTTARTRAKTPGSVRRLPRTPGRPKTPSRCFSSTPSQDKFRAEGAERRKALAERNQRSAVKRKSSLEDRRQDEAERTAKNINEVQERMMEAKESKEIADAAARTEKHEQLSHSAALTRTKAAITRVKRKRDANETKEALDEAELQHNTKKSFTALERCRRRASMCGRRAVAGEHRLIDQADAALQQCAEEELRISRIEDRADVEADKATARAQRRTSQAFRAADGKTHRTMDQLQKIANQDHEAHEREIALTDRNDVANAKRAERARRRESVMLNPAFTDFTREEQ